MNSTDEAPRKTISVVIASYNEVENIRAIYEATRAQLAALTRYDYEILFIDNASTDGTIPILREIAAGDPAHVKVILNARNFGTVRSHPHGFRQATGDAIISMAADFQEPPEMIPQFVELWEQGNYVVYAKTMSEKQSVVLAAIRRFYYAFARRVSDNDLIENFSGFGLYDRRVIDLFREINDPYPYFRGTIAEIGLKRASIPFVRPGRARGFTKNNFLVLYDIAMNGITSHSKMPLHLLTLFGFSMALLSLLVAVVYFIYKLAFWDSFDVGVGPLVIGQFFMSSVIIFTLGVIGEYVAFINVRQLNFPMVVEAERINFPDPPRTADEPGNSEYARSSNPSRVSPPDHH